MTPTEWIADAVAHVVAWEAEHASLDRERAKLPSTEELAALRLAGQSQAADLYSATEHGIADIMRRLDAQVRATVADIVATAQAFPDADRAGAAEVLERMSHGRGRWAASLLLADAPLIQPIRARAF